MGGGGKYLEVKLLDHMAILFLIFWGISILLSTMAVPIYIPTNSVFGFTFPHILPLVISFLFDTHDSDQEKGVSHCGFGLYFPGY